MQLIHGPRTPRRGAFFRLFPSLLRLVTIVVAGALLAAPALAATPDSGGFLENIGQFHESVIFSTSTPGMSIFFTEDGLVIDTFESVMSDVDEPASPDLIGQRRRASPPTPSRRRGSVVRMHFDGLEAVPVVTGGGTRPGVLNFFEGANPPSSHTGARLFSEVTYQEVWPGIDLVFRIAPGGLHYDAIVRPGAEPTRVRFVYDGSDNVSESGGIERIATSVGELSHRLAVAGETSGGIWRGGTEPSMPVVDDCFQLDWVTFLGGSNDDWGTAIVPDGAGRPIVCGVTLSVDFPTVSGAYSEALTSGWDVFVTKLSDSGGDLLWSTYIGGTADEWPTSVNVDASENVVIAGGTESADFPTTSGAYDETPSLAVGDADVFVLKLSEGGDSLLWSTYLGDGLGGTGLFDTANAAVLDADDNVVLCGHTYSPTFPTTAGALKTSHPGGSVRDGYVTKLASAGDSLIWSTLLGADDDNEWVFAIDLDSDGNPVVGGAAFSPSFPTTPGAYDTTYNGEPDDGFLAKLSADGTSLLWSTFLGGASGDLVDGLEIDPLSGDVLTAARTFSADFPTTPGAFDETYNPSIDIVVLRMSEDGSALLWSTFLGGTNPEGHDWVAGIAILPPHAEFGQGNVVVVGDTNSSDFPTTANAFDRTYNGGAYDGFITYVSDDGSTLLWSTFVGGSGPGEDGFGGLDSSLPVVVSGEDIWVTGYTASSDLPTCPAEVWDTTFNEGAYDAVVLKMTFSDLVVGVPDVQMGIGHQPRLGASPNPFRKSAAIDFELPAAGPTRVTVYDVTGRLVRVLRSAEVLSAGTHQLTWDGLDGNGVPATAGVYFVRLETADQWSAQRIVRLR